MVMSLTGRKAIMRSSFKRTCLECSRFYSRMQPKLFRAACHSRINATKVWGETFQVLRAEE